MKIDRYYKIISEIYLVNLMSDLDEKVEYL
jgi:hypothetical protein